MLAFGVSVALGMAPLLGNVGIPGFVSILALFPTRPFDHTTPLIAVTGLLMGLVALAVQYFQDEGVATSKRNRMFVTGAAGLVACLILMFGMYLFSVEQIGDHNVLVGWQDPKCSVCLELPRSACLAKITLATSDIDRCFGSSSVRVAALLLALLYMAALSLLGMLIGLLMLKDRR